MKRRVLLPVMLVVCAALFAVPAKSDTLWDQSAIDETIGGFFNSISGNPPFGLTYYVVNDVTVPASGWMVQSIKVRFSGVSATWGGGISQGRLVVYPKVGSLPLNTENPGTLSMVPMSGAFITGGVNNYWDVTASGLNLALLPGDYWIGITPAAPAGFFGPETQRAAAVHVGDDAATWNAHASPLAWATNAGKDGNILIIGTPGLPTPTAPSTWGAIKKLYR